MNYPKGSPLWMYFNGYSKKRIYEIKAVDWEEHKELLNLEDDL